MKSILIVVFIIVGSRSHSQGIEKHFKLFDVRNNQETTLEKLSADMEDADILFFGEEHNDSAGHYLEAALFKTLYNKFGNKLALSLEMFETDCQLVLDEYLAGHISEERFTREARAWNNYKDYRPLVELAKEKKLDVIAANPPRRYVNMVSRKGMNALDSLPRSSKKYLPPLPYDTASGRYREKFMEFMKGGSPGTGNARIFYSQNLWDAGMAYRIYRYWKKNKQKKILHLVGRFHCDEKLGTAWQLQKKNPKLRIMNISSFSDKDFNNPDWKKFSHLGDYIFLTDANLKKTY